MTATALYTLIAAGAVLGGYALFRRSEGQHAAHGDFATGWDHTTVDYQNPADAVTDQRYERNFFNRPYQIFCPGGEIRPYEIDSHGQPTGRQLVMPGESPTVGDPAEYVMVGWQPAWGHHHHHHHRRFWEEREREREALALAEAEALAAAQQDPLAVATMGDARVGWHPPGHFGHHHHHYGRGGVWALEQQLEQQQEALAEAEALALAAQQDPLATAAMGDFMTGLTPAQLAALRWRRMGMFGGGRQNSLLQQQMLMQQMQQMQQQIDALTAQQQLADVSSQADLLAATATTGDYATGAWPYSNPYASSWRLRRLLGGGGGGWYQRQLLQQQLQQQLLEAQLAQQQAELLAAQQAAAAATTLDPDAAALGAAAGV